MPRARQGYDPVYRAQNAFVKYLQQSGWPTAQRLRAGEHRGTITTPGAVWDVRLADSLRLTPCVTDLLAKCRRTGARYGALVVKPDEVALWQVGRWLAIADWSSIPRWAWPSRLPVQVWPEKPDVRQMAEALVNVSALTLTVHTLTETRTVLCTEVSTALTLLKNASFGENQ